MKKNDADDASARIFKTRMACFMAQILAVFLCGSYFNIVFVIVTWVFLVLKVREHNLLIAVCYAVSVVLQTYQLSVDSRHVFFASVQEQSTCSMSGITTLENFQAVSHMYRGCDLDKFVPFEAQETYPLVEAPDTKLMYRHEAPAGSSIVQGMQVGTCAQLGVLCYVWKIKVEALERRVLEPCWKLVQNIYVVNASHLIMYNKIQTRTPQRNRAAIYNNVTSVHMWFASNSNVPLGVVDSVHRDTQQVDKIAPPEVPDSNTVFVVVPAREARFSGMHLSLGISCHESNEALQSRFRQTGIVSLAYVARPAFFTLHAVFSECTHGCSSGAMMSIGVYATNFIISNLCVFLAHVNSGMVNQFSGLFVFSLCTSIITLNWIATACILTSYMLHGNMRRLLFVLHMVQFVFLVRELVYNRMGTNSTYILSQNTRRTSAFFYASAFMLPFTAVDQNIYLHNCSLYVSTSIFTTYILLFKSPDHSCVPVLYWAADSIRNMLRKR